MANRVPEIECLPKTHLALVGNDYVALDGDVLCHHHCEPSRFTLFCKRADGEFVQQLGVCKHRMLDDLATGIAEKRRRHRGKRIHIGYDQAWLPEGADKILASCEVDGCLAADGGVDHCQKRSWHLDDANASEIKGGGEASHISGHATSEGNYGVIACERAFGESFEDAAKRVERL